ncbi:MAG: hypothetical protein M0Z87_05840 [Actinomycetota bacterium]|nr:hypothetical protein [Actinomycetota bacterium]
MTATKPTHAANRIGQRDRRASKTRAANKESDATTTLTYLSSYSGSKITPMAAEKYSASMDDVLLAHARTDAEAEGLTLSSWLADAAADRLRLKALHRLVDDWEAEHGAISAAELDALEAKVAEARRSAKERHGRAGTTGSGRAVAS